MPLAGADAELVQRIETLERENRLLKIGVRQLTRIRGQWTRSLDELTATKSRLQVSKQFLDQLLHIAPLPILVVTRPRGRITMANAAAEALLGLSGSTLIGGNALALLSRDRRHEFLRCLRTLSTIGPDVPGKTTASVSLLTHDGELRHLEFRWAQIATTPGECDRMIVIAQDITVIKETEDRLRFQSLHDPLTGLPNRVRFRDQLETALAQGKRGRMQVGVIFLDLDGFKQVNDAHGHATGDELLRRVASRLKSGARATDTIARLGGDEFAVIVPGIQAIGSIEVVARKILATISPAYHIDGKICKVSASIGASVYPDDARDIDSLMKFADMAMYRVKAAGRDAYQFFTPDMNREAARRLSLLGRMQRGLLEGEFVVHFQPQVSLASRRIVGLEALLRWQDPGEGMILPGDFIGLAEEHGFIKPLGEHVLYQACRQAVSWSHLGCATISVSVNLSARQLHDHQLPDLIRRVLSETGIAPGRLVLELTESSVIENLQHAEAILREIGALGVQFALDDFGSGHASLAHLKRLPFSQIKIGHNFIRDLETDACDVAISDAIIRMANALGLTVIGEGIETAGQLRLLDRLKCHHAQGHYFSHPLPAHECRLLLTRAPIWADRDLVVSKEDSCAS